VTGEIAMAATVEAATDCYRQIATGDYRWSRPATSVRLFTNKVLKTLREVAQVARPLPAASKVDKGGSEHA